MHDGVREGIARLQQKGLCGGTDDILSCATTFLLSNDVQVCYRHATKNWAVVVEGSWVLNDQGHREWEPSPSNRDEAFINSTRFDFATAWEMATKMAIQLRQLEIQQQILRGLKETEDA